MAHPARKLALAPAALSVERIALRAAVERHAAAVRRLAATVAAQEKTASAISNARDALADATEALEKAKSAASAAIAGTLRCKPTKSVAAARAELTESEDALAAAMSAEVTLTTQHADAEQASIYARMALDRAIRDTVRAETATAKLLANFQDAHRAFVSLRRALEFLSSKDLLPPDDARLWACERDWPELAAETARWKSWITSLETDADAPL